MKSETRSVFALMLGLVALVALAVFAPQAIAQPRAIAQDGEAVPMTTIYKSIDGRVYARAVPTVMLGYLAQASTHAGAPDLTMTWKCRAGTMTKNWWKSDYADAHEMDVAAAHEVEQCQAIALFSPID